MKSLISITVFCLILSVIAASAADIWLSERIAVIGSFLGLQYSLNPGIAWGIRLPSGLQELLILCAIIAVGYVAYQSCKPVSDISYFVFRLRQIAFGCILGGGLANMIDRLRDGFVTDFFQIGTFPIFNVADSFVTIGVSILLLELMYTKYKIRDT